MGKVTKIISGLTGFLGVLVFSLSIWQASQPDSLNNGLLLLLLAYFIGLIAIAVYTANLPSTGSKFSEISLLSFFTFCLFIPFAFFTVVLTLHSNTGLLSKELAQILCWSIQALCIGIWFFPKLRKLSKQKSDTNKEVSLMKLDYYSTLAILLLTIVWVVYDILSIKIGFAIIMGEFLLVQMIIKREQIRQKEITEAGDDV